MIFLLSVSSAFAQEKSTAALAPIGVMGEINEIDQQIIFNSLQESLSKYYTLTSQKMFEKAEEEAFQQMDDEECTEDQCIAIIQELLQVENFFMFQILKTGTFQQLKLSRIDLDNNRDVRTTTCQNCDLEQLNNKVNGLVIAVSEDTEITSVAEVKKDLRKDAESQPLTLSSDYLRIYGYTNIIVLYYRLLGNAGFGISSITSDSIENECVQYSVNGSCYNNEDLSIKLTGNFILAGYDFESDKMIISTYFGIPVSGGVACDRCWHSDVSKEIDSTSSYQALLSFGYRGIREYGLGFSYSLIKQKTDNTLAVGITETSNVNSWLYRSSRNSPLRSKSEVKPVLWIGFNW